MRLIDADVLNNFIDKWLSKKCDEHGNTTPNEWLDSLKRCVDEQPTAYDIDKVVEELEERKHEICLSDDDLEHYQNGIDEAIEIVKQGGISNDVCEWRLCDEEANVYDTSCRNPHILIESTPKENNYEYCPYCGKKIKVVGDRYDD